VEIMVVFGELNTGPRLIGDEKKHDLMRDFVINGVI